MESLNGTDEHQESSSESELRIPVVMVMAGMLAYTALGMYAQKVVYESYQTQVVCCLSDSKD